MTTELTVQESAVKSLYTVDEAAEHLMTLSNGSTKWTCSGDNQITVPDAWPSEFFDAGEFAPSEASLLIEGTEIPLAKTALLQVAKKFGLGSRYALTIPPALLKSNLDYWLTNSGVDLRLLTLNGVGVGFSKSPLAPTVHAADAFHDVITTLEQVTGVSSDEFYVDYKFTHSLDDTRVRIVQPYGGRSITSLRDGETEDLWHWGLQFSHSTTAQYPTSLEGYMFAWWCTNGAISTHGAAAKFDRRTQHSDTYDDWVNWVTEAVEDVAADMPNELGAIQTLTDVNLKGELSDAANAVFNRYKIPRGSRSSVLNALVESDDWSAYGLMNAVTQAANPSDVPESVRNLLFRAGGDMAVAFAERCETCHRL